MNYQKPEVKILADAVEAVQTIQKNFHTIDPTPFGVGPAYEADE